MGQVGPAGSTVTMRPHFALDYLTRSEYVVVQEAAQAQCQM